MDVLDAFSPASRQWFSGAFGAPTQVQAAGWTQVAAGAHALMLAPTGSGKTLAGFFWAIDRLVRLPKDALPGVRVLYVSPLKALVTDIERNLRAPLVGVMRQCERMGQAVRPIAVGVRTGDTPAKERARLLRAPPDILVTTPESLFLLLGSQAKRHLTQVHTLIVDEIHAVASTKRGAHLALSLERLEAGCAAPPQRIGLSATVHPREEAARFLGGAREVAIVDFSQRPALSLRVEVPVADMARPQAEAQTIVPSPPAALTPAGAGEADEGDAKGFVGHADDVDADNDAADVNVADGADATGEANDVDGIGGSILGQIARAERAQGQAAKGPQAPGLWAAIYPRILALLQAHRTTLVFVNSRSSCERMAKHLNEMAGEDLVRAHHGSVSLKKRGEIEAALKAGTLRGIVATSSLELGIDMGTVELVVLVESPGSVARGLQRVGRAGHGVGETSHGVIFPKHQADLLESAVIAGRMRAGTIEPLTVPRNPLDVLAQQLVAICAEVPHTLDALHTLVRRSYPFAQLTSEALRATLEMLSGHYPGDEFAELRPLLRWDRATDEISGRRSAKLVAQLNAGTIPDRGTFGVFLVGERGPRVGELDEEMVHESRKGDVFTLGASSWRIEQITRDKVLVVPAPGEAGRLPFWRGEGPGRPIELGRAVGAMVRRLDAADEAGFGAIAQDELGLDPFARQNLHAYLRAQREATRVVPHDRQIVVERFRDELGDWRVCILTPFGARVHAPWALALEARLAEHLGHAVQTLYNDDGIALRIEQGARLPELDALLPDPDALEDAVVQELGRSALFAGAFRENAARALLLPRRRSQGRSPLWQQRLRSKTLLAAAERYPSFPIVLETYRQCLRDVFDVPALRQLLVAIARREVRVEEVHTEQASPFARSLAFAYVAAYLYEGDGPLAERRAQALVLDHQMLRTLLGEVDVRRLLDQAALDEVVASLQRLAEGRRVRDADGVHDLMRTLGDLSVDEVVARARLDDGQGPALRAQVDAWLASLVAQKRAFAVRLAGARRYLAVADAGRYRDALGVVVPGGLPIEAHAAHPDDALRGLVARYARTHGPFVAGAVADRYALSTQRVEEALQELARAGTVVQGEFLPHGHHAEWCDQEVLRRLKRATLAKLRNEVAAVPAAAYARFLPGWHGLEAPRRGIDGVRTVLEQLAGLPLSFASWCQEILPARVADFVPDMLDLLCATGQVVWVGAGALGSRDGRVAFYTRAQAARLLEAPAPMPAPQPLHVALLDRLQTRGPAFAIELQAVVPGTKGERLTDALWDLAWAGLVTNDTVQPLRALKVKSPRLGHAIGGRWSAVVHLLQGAPDLTELAHARATMLLERYGIASRQAAAFEGLVGGFTPIYQLLKAMEEAGKVRRGLFVEGLGGAQFGYGGAIERLRAGHRPDEGRTPVVRALAALDPANPYGSLLPWPARYDDAHAPQVRRVAGARVLTSDGAALAYLDASGEQLTLFSALRADEGHWARLAQALRQLGRNAKGRSLRLQRIDQMPALQHPALQRLLDGGLVATYDGLMLGEGT